MQIKTSADAIQRLSSIDSALDRLITQGIENAFIVAGSHNDLLAVIEYLKTHPAPAPIPETKTE